MQDVWTRKRRQPWPMPWNVPGFVVGAIWGFAVCYVIGAALMFHFLVTVGYTPAMATARSVLWMWTARVGTAQIETGMREGKVKISKPVCPEGSVSEWWC